MEKGQAQTEDCYEIVFTLPREKPPPASLEKGVAMGKVGEGVRSFDRRVFRSYNLMKALSGHLFCEDKG